MSSDHDHGPPPTAQEIAASWAIAATPEEIRDAIAGASVTGLTYGELTELRAALRRKLVLQAIGEASLCWDRPPTGVFDSQRAIDIAERLLTELAAVGGGSR
jgi:hypothetical protein